MKSLLWIPGLYLLLMVVIGFIAAKRQETKSDFYVASNSMGGSVLFATIFSTVVGANTYMGFSGMVYSDGFSMIWMLAAAGSSYFLLFFLSGKIRRIASQHQVFTLPDMMELRYNRPVAWLTTLFSLVGLVGGAGGSMLGIGLILNTLLGIDTTTAIVITSVVTILYTTFGGLWGVALTDWVQTLIMVVGLILVLAFGFPALSPDAGILDSFTQGASKLSGELGAASLSLTEGATFLMVIAWAITFMPLNTISQTQIQRVYASKSTSLIRRISLLMVLFVALFTAFALAMVGTLGKALEPGLENPEIVFPIMALKVIHPVVGMIVVTGVLGACMSTVDSNLLGAGIHISRDMVERQQRGRREELSEKQSIRLTQGAVVMIGVLSTAAAIITPSILELLLVTMHIFAGATFIPVLAGLYWKRANSQGAMTALILGGLCTLLAEILKPPLDPVLIGIIGSVAGMVAGTLWTHPETSVIDVQQLKLDLNSDLPWLFGVLGFCFIFFLALLQLNLWPLIIGISLAALCLSVLLLIGHFIKEARSRVYKGTEEKGIL